MRSMQQELDLAVAQVASLPSYLRVKPLTVFETSTLERAIEMLKGQIAEIEAVIESRKER